MPNSASMTSLGLPRMRHEQLRQFAEQHGLTMSATLGELLKIAREAQRADPGIPSVRIAPTDAGLSVQLDDRPAHDLASDGPRCLIETLREMAAPRSERGTTLNLDHDFQVKRQGPAIGVQLGGERGTRALFSPDLAEEFADLLEAALELKP